MAVVMETQQQRLIVAQYTTHNRKSQICCTEAKYRIPSLARLRDKISSQKASPSSSVSDGSLSLSRTMPFKKRKKRKKGKKCFLHKDFHIWRFTLAKPSWAYFFIFYCGEAPKHHMARNIKISLVLCKKNIKIKKLNKNKSELRRCVKVKVAVLGSPFLTVRMVSMDVKQR